MDQGSARDVLLNPSHGGSPCDTNDLMVVNTLGQKLPRSSGDLVQSKAVSGVFAQV